MHRSVIFHIAKKKKLYKPRNNIIIKYENETIKRLSGRVKRTVVLKLSVHTSSVVTRVTVYANMINGTVEGGVRERKKKKSNPHFCGYDRILYTR